jgi:hypothetical protein
MQRIRGADPSSRLCRWKSRRMLASRRLPQSSVGSKTHRRPRCIASQLFLAPMYVRSTAGARRVSAECVVRLLSSGEQGCSIRQRSMTAKGRTDVGHRVHTAESLTHEGLQRWGATARLQHVGGRSEQEGSDQEAAADGCAAHRPRRDGGAFRRAVHAAKLQTIWLHEAFCQRRRSTPGLRERDRPEPYGRMTSLHREICHFFFDHNPLR